ncbi:MAG: hypothetical protein IPN20_01350 [Haliscomenobacter sp.]|nr:hypothetical protein [Haliscomenobacter sp.]
MTLHRLLFTCLTLLGVQMAAQHPALQPIGVEQGLPQGFVTCIAQDKEGFIWMGTPTGGLSRYDGYRFWNCSSNPFDPNSLSGNFIYSIADLDDYLFAGTMWDGANLYHKKTGRFFRLPFIANPNSTPQSTIKNRTRLPGPSSALLAKSPDGSLWVRSHRHPVGAFWLSRVIVPQGFWENLPLATPEEQAKWLAQIQVQSWPMDNLFTGLLEDESTLCRVDGNQVLAWRKDQWQPLPVPGGLPKQLSRQIPDKFDPGANYWQTTHGEIWRSSGGGLHWQKVDNVPPGMMVLQLEKGFALTRLQDRYQAFAIKRSPWRILFSKPLWTIEIKDERTIWLLDSSKNLWSVNGVSGVTKFNPLTTVFNANTNEKNRFDRPFLTTPRGVLVFNNYPNIGLSISGAPQEYVDFLQSVLSSDRIRWGIVRSDGRNKVWIGASNQLILADLDSRLVKSYRLPYHSKIQHPPNEFLVNPDGSILFPLGGVLMHLDPDTNAAMGLDFSHVGLDGLQIYAVEKTADQSIWLGTDDGLLRIFPNPEQHLRTSQLQASTSAQPLAFPVFKAKTALYKTNPSNPKSLRHNFTVSLLTDPKDANILWVATKGGGLNAFDIRTGQFTHIPTPDNVIYGILPDHAGNLWLSSNKGLIRYHPKTGTIKSFHKSDGLQDDEFNTSAFAKDGNGFLYFGGVNGMNVFDPAHIKTNPNRPKVRFTGLIINDKPVEAGDSTGILKENIVFCKSITLPFHQNNITLEFAALEFTAPSKNQYKYWLKGLEKKKEIHLSTEPQATYFSLPPGKYTFIVYGSNNDGVWSEKPASIRIRILPPWYRHWLAYLCYIAIVSSLGIWLWRLREKRKKLEYHLALEQQEAKLQAELHRHELKELEKQQEMERQKAEHERQFHLFRLEETTQRLLEKTRILEEFERQQSVNEDFASKTRLAASPILTREDWEQFQERFSKVHPNFLHRLNARFPSLTPSETRLILLMKLGLDTLGIASMLGISPDSVKKTRHRLRRKLTALQISMERLLSEE